MPTLTVRPGPTNSTLIGAFRCSNATYSVARDGTGTFTGNDSGVDFIFGGQNTTYQIHQMYFGFALGSAVAGAVVTDVTFEFTTYSSNVTGGETQAILDYTAGNISSADWQDGTELAALTSFGSIAKGTAHSNNTTYQYSMNAAARAAAQTALRAGGTFSFMIVDQNVIDNVAPVANDNWYICSEAHATAASRPAIIITYTTDIEVAVPSGALTIAGQTPAPLLDRVTAVPAGSLAIAGQAPSLVVDRLVSVPAGALSIAGQVPLPVVEIFIGVPAAALSIAGQAPGVAVDRLTSIPAGALVIAGKTPTVQLDRAVSIPAAALVIAGRAPVMSQDRVFAVPAGALVLAGLDLRRAGAQWNAAPTDSAVWTEATPADGTWTPAPLAN